MNTRNQETEERMVNSERVEVGEAPECSSLEALLAKPVHPDNLSHKTGSNGRQVPYISHRNMFAIANGIFGRTGWTYEVLDLPQLQTLGDQAMYQTRVRVTLSESGLTRTEVGSCTVNTSRDGKLVNEAVEHAAKGAVTDAVKRALHGLGPAFGLDLYR